MKTILIILIIIVVTVMTGTWLLSFLGWMFTALGTGLEWLANILDFFNFKGKLFSISQNTGGINI